MEKLSFSFPSSIFASGWEWDFDLRNNKPNNRQCVTPDPQLAEGAGERYSGKDKASEKFSWIHFSIMAPRLAQVP